MLYLHVPYCHRKCTYCAFYSAVTGADKQAYVDALCAELRQRRDAMQHPLRTVYFGGGTPTILSLAQLEQIVDCVEANYDLSVLEEATIEANPEDLDTDFLQGLRSLGFFNRLSIGVQSFHDADLRLLNRRHTAQQSFEAVERAFAQGFGNISVDLIYALPGQDEADWNDNLAHLQRLPVSHLSAYSLSVEPGTMLERQIDQGRIVPATDDMSVRHYQSLLAWGLEHGFEQYEISNFCREGKRSLHNSRYWNRTPYLGVGAAAHSFDGHRRRWNVADVSQYINSCHKGGISHETELLSVKDAYNEYVMISLRTVAGIDKALVPNEYAATLSHDVGRFVSAGLIEETATHFRPTPDGLLHADGIASELFLL